MKKIFAFFSALIFMLSLVACDKQSGKDFDEAETYSFNAKVLEADGDYLLVEPLADSNESKSANRIQISLKDKTASWYTPAVDDLIKITYDGVIMESYPAQIGTVYGIEISTIQPNEIPTYKTFDFTVSYANSAVSSDIIYTKALNNDKISINSIRHLPIYKFDTLAELEQFKTDIDGILSIDQSYNEIPSFNDATVNYDEEFFAENSLMLVYIEASSGSYRYGVDSVYNADGNFCIHITQTNNPSPFTDDMAGWFITVAVSDSMIADCTEFDADLQ